MKYTLLFTGADNKSHFKDIDIEVESKQPLGNYSKKFSVEKMMFRDFEKGAHFDWHPAPQPQYIIYLEGEVESKPAAGKSVYSNQGMCYLQRMSAVRGTLRRHYQKENQLL